MRRPRPSVFDTERCLSYATRAVTGLVASSPRPMSSNRVRHSTARDRRGRKWDVALVPTHLADEEDFRFWFEELTGEQRVVAVRECLLSSLRARGIHEVPRLRRVARRVQRGKR